MTNSPSRSFSRTKGEKAGPHREAGASTVQVHSQAWILGTRPFGGRHRRTNHDACTLALPMNHRVCCGQRGAQHRSSQSQPGGLKACSRPSGICRAWGVPLQSQPGGLKACSRGSSEPARATTPGTSSPPLAPRSGCEKAAPRWRPPAVNSPPRSLSPPAKLVCERLGITRVRARAGALERRRLISRHPSGCIDRAAPSRFSDAPDSQNPYLS
jgi:hypothetical protein